MAQIIRPCWQTIPAEYVTSVEAMVTTPSTNESNVTLYTSSTRSKRTDGVLTRVAGLLPLWLIVTVWPVSAVRVVAPWASAGLVKSMSRTGVAAASSDGNQALSQYTLAEKNDPCLVN